MGCEASHNKDNTCENFTTTYFSWWLQMGMFQLLSFIFSDNLEKYPFMLMSTQLVDIADYPCVDSIVMFYACKIISNFQKKQTL